MKEVQSRTLTVEGYSVVKKWEELPQVKKWEELPHLTFRSLEAASSYLSEWSDLSHFTRLVRTQYEGRRSQIASAKTSATFHCSHLTAGIGHCTFGLSVDSRRKGYRISLLDNNHSCLNMAYYSQLEDTDDDSSETGEGESESEDERAYVTAESTPVIAQQSQSVGLRASQPVLALGRPVMQRRPPSSNAAHSALTSMVALTPMATLATSKRKAGADGLSEVQMGKGRLLSPRLLPPTPPQSQSPVSRSSKLSLGDPNAVSITTPGGRERSPSFEYEVVDEETEVKGEAIQGDLARPSLPTPPISIPSRRFIIDLTLDSPTPSPVPEEIVASEQGRTDIASKEKEPLEATQQKSHQTGGDRRLSSLPERLPEKLEQFLQAIGIQTIDAYKAQGIRMQEVGFVVHRVLKYYKKARNDVRLLERQNMLDEWEEILACLQMERSYVVM